MGCRVCGREDCENAHVKSKSEFKECFIPDDFKNIIPLCNQHHRDYFDKGRMAILIKQQKFLLLERINPSLIVEKPVIGGRLDLNPKYVKWKHNNCRWALKARLIKIGVL